MCAAGHKAAAVDSAMQVSPAPLTFTHLPAGCEDFVDLITPELQHWGPFRTAYQGRTLRENLGLKPHVNRYVAQRMPAEARLASD